MVRSGFLLIVSMLILSTSLSSSYMFNVGGRNGWGVRRSPEHYNAWSSRTRFQINDTLRKFNPICLMFCIDESLFISLLLLCHFYCRDVLFFNLLVSCSVLHILYFIQSLWINFSISKEKKYISTIKPTTSCKKKKLHHR